MVGANKHHVLEGAVGRMYIMEGEKYTTQIGNFKH